MHTIHSDNRKSGIALIGDLPWGSHFCQFYQNDNDLLDILVPYFRAGLENNELCVWVTSMPLGVKNAKKALKKAVPQFEEYAGKGQMEIIPYSRWRPGEAGSGGAIATKLDKAIFSGFDGLRLACNAFPEKKGGKAFISYGADVISRYNVIAIFAYPRDEFDAVGLMEVVKNHRFALVRNADRWEVIESSEVRIVKDALKRSEEKLHSLFSNMSEGFAYHRIVLDGGGRPCDYLFLEVNEAFERLTGLKGKNIIGKRATEALPGIDKDPTNWIETYGKVALTGKPVHFESYSRPLGKWYSVSAFSPHKGYFAVTFSDITEKKKYEEALENAHDELKEHATRLEAVNKELESFSYSVSHDLRSPLRAIVGFARMILDEKGATFDPETRRKFGIIQENAQKMGRLIDDLLRLSRLGRTELKRSKLDMDALVREVMQEIRMAEPEREFVTEIGDLPTARGDPAMIRQLLVNLLSNAVKFTRDQQDARIEVGGFERSGEQVYYVKDNGVGFDMKYYSKLFGVFQRLVSESQFEGTGVGLALVQRIVQRHGGRIWAEGKIQRGATFYFTLPD